jgi:hypothetical protein
MPREEVNNRYKTTKGNREQETCEVCLVERETMKNREDPSQHFFSFLAPCAAALCLWPKVRNGREMDNRGDLLWVRRLRKTKKCEKKELSIKQPPRPRQRLAVAHLLSTQDLHYETGTIQEEGKNKGTKVILLRSRNPWKKDSAPAEYEVKIGHCVAVEV